MNVQEKERRAASMTRAELAEWDAEIEADFQRTVETTTKPRKRKRAKRHIGCPWEFLVEVTRSRPSANALIVALYIYRQTTVHRSPTVRLSGPELTELGVTRNQKHRALHNLARVGMIRLHPVAPGRTTEITLLWPAT
jgi:hypothetical protein